MNKCFEAEKNLSQTQSSEEKSSAASKSPSSPEAWLKRLSLWQGYWLVFFAAWMPISISAIWIGIAVGGVFWTATSALALKMVLDEMPKDGSVKAFSYVRERFLAVIGFDKLPLFVPMGVFVLVLMACGFYVGVTPGPLEAGIRVSTRTLVSLKALVVYPWVYQTIRRCPQMITPTICAMLAMSSLSCLYSPIEPYMKTFLREITKHPPQDPNLLSLYHMSEGFIKWVVGTRMDFLQGTGFLEQPMAFAGQMQTVMMIALALWLCQGYKKLPGIFSKRSTAVAIACCIAVGIVFGAERSAWLGVFFGVLVVGFSVSRKTVIALMLSLSVIAVLSYLTVPIVKDRVDVLLSGNDPSVTSRIMIWEATFDKFKQHPICGTSLMRFGSIHAHSAMPDKGYFDHAHSNYLHMLAATGVVGFTAYIYLLFMIFSTTAKLSKPLVLEGLSEKEVEPLKFKRSIAVGLLAASVSLAVSGLFEFNFGTGHVRLTYFFFLAFLGLNAQSMRSQEKEGEPNI